MATESTPLTSGDVTSVSGSQYTSFSKYETDRTPTSPTCLKPRCFVYAALL